MKDIDNNISITTFPPLLLLITSAVKRVILCMIMILDFWVWFLFTPRTEFTVLHHFSFSRFPFIINHAFSKSKTNEQLVMMIKVMVMVTTTITIMMIITTLTTNTMKR